MLLSLSYFLPYPSLFVGFLCELGFGSCLLVPWHAWCYRHSQRAASWRTLACSQGAAERKDGGCQGPEKAPAVSLQGRGRRVPSSVGGEAGSSSLLLLLVCAERRKSLCPTLSSAKGLSWGEMIGGWAFAWEETAMVLFPTLPVCIRRARKQMFASPSHFHHELAKVNCLWLKSVAAKGGKHRNPSCCKPQCCRYRPTDSVYHQLSVLTVGFHSRQSGDLVPQSLCLCWLTASDVQN